MGRVWLRTFCHPTPTTVSHAFVIGSAVGGLSERIGTFLINDDTTTFTDLRQKIEVFNDNGMNRRTAMYQDLLHLMATGSNPHEYEGKKIMKYRFGVIEGIGGQELGDTNFTRDYDKSLVPRLIDSEVESEPIKEVVGNLLELDILLVPVSQIRPQDGSVTAQIWQDTFETEEEKMKRTVDHINEIDLTKYSLEKIQAANNPSREEEENAMELAESGEFK